MTDVPGAADFEAALGDLQDHLPYWWASQDPTSNLYAVLVAIAAQLDALAVIYETLYLDQDLQTATAEGLQRNFAFAWGVQNEQLPTVLPEMRAYISARAQEDGSIASLISTLTTLVNVQINTTGGSVLTFPSNGSGLYFPDPAGTNLVFPPGGGGIGLPATFGNQPEGLALYEFSPGNGPAGGAGLVFPPDGSGLIFPPYPDTITTDNVITDDGSPAVGAGPGLIFASNQFVQIVPNWAAHTLVVKVQNWLTFDRPAFARAVSRFQPADWLPSQIVEWTTYH